MGIGFVILMHLAIVFIFSVIVATIGSVLTYFIADKEKRKRKTFVAFISPFVGLNLLYIFCLIGSIIISETKKIDIGIGDAWYVPLGNNCQLLFIDLPELAFIEKGDQIVISEVSQIESHRNLIWGTTNEGKYFQYDTQSNELRNFVNEDELLKFNSKRKLNLKKVIDFYNQKRKDIAGFWLIFVGVISLILSVTITYLLGWLLLRDYKFRNELST